jgi:hypothetical protein
MARTDYGPEVKSAMGGNVGKKPPVKRPATGRPDPNETPADLASDKAKGIAQGSPQDQAMDARLPPGGAVAPQPPHPPAQGVHPAHAMMAASIAHAILGGSKGGGY